MNYTHLISTGQLQELLAQNAPLLIFDCSSDLMNPPLGYQHYLQTHIRGARFADLNRDLAAHGRSDSASGGRHPLPARTAFAAWLGQQGFSNTLQAVVYDRNGCNYCGRLWWMLKWAGHDAVAVLDGGLQAWQKAGGAVASGPAPDAAPASFALAAPLRELATTADVLACLPTASQGAPARPIIDARAALRFRGEVEPLDPVAGHIPGALNRPFGSNLNAEGFFKSAAELRAEFQALLSGQASERAAIHHCGSGVSALPNVLAMELAGYAPSALYAGSWSEWCSDPARPVARG